MKKVMDTVRQGRQGPFLVMTEREFREADNSSQGMCMACGDVADGVEPDACRYTCEACDAPRVYGMAEALMMNRVRIEEETAE